MAMPTPTKVARDSTGVPLPLVFVRVGHVAVTVSSTGATTSSTIDPATALVELVSDQPFHFNTGHSSITAATTAGSPYVPANTPTVVPLRRHSGGDVHNRVSVIGVSGGTDGTVHIHALGTAPIGG